MTLNSSLLQWLATFKLDNQASIELKDDAHYNLADGYICARILNQISPQYFSDKWLEGIKPVPPNGSWRLRLSNLKRILQKIYDYASDLQSPQFRPSAIQPDVAVIAVNFEPDQLSRLIQLILFCAINCDKKQYYIEKIHELPTQVKQDIKAAIEELLIVNADGNQKLNTSQTINDSFKNDSDAGLINSSHKSNLSQNSFSTPSRAFGPRVLSRRDSGDLFRRNDSNLLDTSTNSTTNNDIEDVLQKLKAALKSNEEEAQACYELETQIRHLKLEKEQLAFENEQITRELISSKRIATNSIDEGSDKYSFRRNSDVDQSKNSHNHRDDGSEEHLMKEVKKLQNETNRLESEMIKVESEKEDYRLKANFFKDELEKVSSKHDELRSKAELAKRLQDELDEQRHISEKVFNYEAMIENLVKKNNEMKHDIKNLEEKNLAHVQNIVQLEEQSSQLSSALNRIDTYKKQLSETQTKLSQETHRADQLEVELLHITEKLTAVKKENEKLYETTNQLRHNKSMIDTTVQQRQQQQNQSSADGFANDTFAFGDENKRAVVDTEIDNEAPRTPSIDLKERIVRLEMENDLLKRKLQSKNDEDHSVLNGLLENSTLRCTKLEADYRQSKKRIHLLESRLIDLTNSQGGPSTGVANLQETSSDNTLALMNRVEELQRLLFQREQELLDSETKYKKNLQKAKDVIKSLNSNQLVVNNSLHPSCISSTSSFNSNSLDECNLLRQQLRDREERLLEMEREFTEFKRLKEVHERLILSAFYGLWKNAEKRLERTTLTSPPNTASSSMNHSKHSH